MPWISYWNEFEGEKEQPAECVYPPGDCESCPIRDCSLRGWMNEM